MDTCATETSATTITTYINFACDSSMEFNIRYTGIKSGLILEGNINVSV